MTPSNPDMSAEKPSRNHEGRKSSKPMMEKRRRARINDCLTELQSILDALNPEGSGTRQNKREKADILEQTVRLVKQLRQHGGRGNPPDHHTQVQFRAGFNECMETVTQFLRANQGSLNGEAKAGLMSHLANSLQCNNKDVYAERLPHAQLPRRRIDEPVNSMCASVKPQPTSSQSETCTGSSGASSTSVVHPMPAAAAATIVTSPSSNSTVALPVNMANAMQSALPGLTARLELTPNGANGTNAAARIVPIGIPIKVQSPGQYILVPSNMFNGNQLTTPIIPVLSPPTASLAASPPSSAGSSGSVAISPAPQQSPQKTPAAQPQSVSAPAAVPQGAIMYASCPAAMGAPAGSVGGAAGHPPAPYPVAFVAMGEPAEGQNGAQLEHLMYPNIPRFYVPANMANPPDGTGPPWRPW